MGKFLKNGIERLKSGSLPAKADTHKQRVFYDDVLRQLIDKAGETNWSCCFSGRRRYNVLGEIDYATKTGFGQCTGPEMSNCYRTGSWTKSIVV